MEESASPSLKLITAALLFGTTFVLFAALLVPKIDVEILLSNDGRRSVIFEDASISLLLLPTYLPAFLSASILSFWSWSLKPIVSPFWMLKIASASSCSIGTSLTIPPAPIGCYCCWSAPNPISLSYKVYSQGFIMTNASSEPMLPKELKD